MLRTRSSQSQRAGFTLIELLVVLSILVVLASLTVSAVMKFRGTGPRIATKSGLKKIKGSLDAQWKAVLDKGRVEPIPGNLGLGNPQDPSTRTAYLQLKVQQAFPLSFDEVLNPAAGTLPPWSGYVNYLRQELGVDKGNTTPPETQRAICLMMALERGPSNLNVTAEALGTSAAQLLNLSVNVKNPPNALPIPLKQPQASGCVDGFGTPLLFTRSLNNTPLSPWILSAGADGLPGVDPNTFAITNPAQAQDNLDPNSP